MIAIAGGTGRMGRVLAQQLVERGLQVRILTRDPERVPETLRNRVDTATVDLRQPASIGPALTGVETLVSAITGFGGPGAAGARVVDRDGNLALIEAAEAAGVEHVVLLSVARAAPDAPVALFRAKYDAEQRLRASRLAWTIIRPTAYMETWIEVVGRPLVATGHTRVFGRGQNPVNFVSADDVARIVETVITEPGHRGETVVVAGPANLSMNAFVETISRVTGRTGRVDHANPAVMRVMAAMLGFVNPVLADQVRAALFMDTRDLRVDPADRLARFPSVPLTLLEDVVRRQLTPVANHAVAAPTAS